MRELLRAHELAFKVKLPAGSIAKLLNYEFELDLEAQQVRNALRHHFNWRGTEHGRPIRGSKAA